MTHIIFSDVDGTLVHKSDGSGELVQIPGGRSYISAEAVGLIQGFRDQGHLFAIITGRRRSGFDRIAEVIPYDVSIIEHGCVVLDGDDVDVHWHERMSSVVGTLGNKDGALWEYEQRLLDQGYRTDSEGRSASFRLFKDRPDNLSEDERTYIEKKVEDEMGHAGLTTTRNIDMLDVIPAAGGKANAMKYLVEQYGLGVRDVVALGDDFNDIDMLEYACEALCPGNAKPVVRELVRAKNGYVSDLGGHAGTVDILTKIYKQLDLQ